MTPAFELVRRQAQALPLGEQLSLAAELIETARRIAASGVGRKRIV